MSMKLAHPTATQLSTIDQKSLSGRCDQSRANFARELSRVRRHTGESVTFFPAYGARLTRRGETYRTQGGK